MKGYQFLYTHSKKTGSDNWTPSEFKNRRIIRGNDELIFVSLDPLAPEDVKILWAKMMDSEQKVCCQGDPNMMDDSVVADPTYYPFRVTFESKEYELLMAEGIFEEGVRSVNYVPEKNYDSEGNPYKF